MDPKTHYDVIIVGGGPAGLFSDGKLNYIHKLGKTDLTQFLARSQAEALIDETELIFNRFGMDGPTFPTNMAEARRLRKEAKKHGIDLLLIKQKHLGSDCLPRHITAMAEHIARRVDIRTGEAVEDVLVANQAVTGVRTAQRDYQCRQVILAPGRVGAAPGTASARGISNPRWEMWSAATSPWPSRKESSAT